MTLLNKLFISLLSITSFIAIIMSALFIYQTLSVGHNNQLAVQVSQAFFLALIVIWLSLYGLSKLSTDGSVGRSQSSLVDAIRDSGDLEPAYEFYTWMFLGSFFVAAIIVLLFTLST